MIVYHPVGVEFMVKERQRELLNSVGRAYLQVETRESLSDRLANFMHELGHWLENLGSRLRKRYQPITSASFSCSGGSCRQPCS